MVLVFKSFAGKKRARFGGSQKIHKIYKYLSVPILVDLSVPIFCLLCQMRGEWLNNLMRGHLKLAVLSFIEKKDMSGSEIMEKIEKEFGWKPSCGSVYPVLNSLVEENLARVRNLKEGKHRKIYALTPKGKSELKKKKIQRKDLADEIVRIHKMVASLYNVDTSKVEAMVQDMNNGKIPFASIHSEVEEVKMEMFRLESNDLIEKNKEQLREILKNTAVKLRALRKDNPATGKAAAKGRKK
jgi:DNA-binding PadR family transcriptional regulator